MNYSNTYTVTNGVNMSDVKSVEINGQNIYEIWDDNGNVLWPNNTGNLTVKNITNPFYFFSRYINNSFTFNDTHYRAMVLCANNRLNGKYKNISGAATRRQYYYNYNYNDGSSDHYELQLPVYQGPDVGLAMLRRAYSNQAAAMEGYHIYGLSDNDNHIGLNLYNQLSIAPSLFIMREFNEIQGVYISPYFNDTVFISKYMTKTCLLKYTKDLNEALDFTPCLLDDPFTMTGVINTNDHYRYKDIIAGNITLTIFTGENYPLAYDPDAIITGELDDWVLFTTPQGPKYNTVWSMVQPQRETYPGLTVNSEHVSYGNNGTINISSLKYNVGATWYIKLTNHKGEIETITDNSMTWEKYKQYIKQYIGQILVN